MPEPRTPYAVWAAWGDRYTLRSGNHELAVVEFTKAGDLLTEVFPATVVETMHASQDVAALTHWLSRGGR